MTKAEAAAMFGVSEDVPLGELRRRYETLHTDYQIRLTNAPTPALKKTYQQKLQELVEGGELLSPGFSANTQGGDLPSSEPTLDIGPEPIRREPKVTYGREDNRRTPAAATGTEGLPRSTVVAGVVAVLLAAVLSVAVLRWMQASDRAAALQVEGEKVLQSAKALQVRVDSVEQLLFADRLRIRNLSSKSIRITAVAFVYRDQTGAMKVAHSGNYDYPTWDIRPGSVVQLDTEMARGRLWDGPVLYYSFLVEYPDVEPFLKAGIWANDIDRIDKVVTLDLD